MRKVSFAAWVLFGAALGSCTPRPFLRTDGPTSAGGVTVAPLNQRCGRRYDNPISDVLELTMALQVSNSAGEPATFLPEDVRLMVDGEVVPPEARDPAAEIAPGSSKVLSVHFLRYGDATCNEPMSLSLAHAVRLGNGELSVRPLYFTPNASDT
jgi:hypothetical protein